MIMNTATLRWPAFLIALFLTFVVFSWWSLQRAALGVSSVTDANYYRHGLKYNSASVELQAGQALHWRLSPQLAGRRLTVRVVDGQEAPVSGASGELTLQPEGARPGAVTPPLALTSSGPGSYTVTLPDDVPRQVAANLTLSRDQVTVQRRLLINLE